MLLYNIKLHCYVVVEVKVTAFEPTFAGQLGTNTKEQCTGEYDIELTAIGEKKNVLFNDIPITNRSNYTCL